MKKIIGFFNTIPTIKNALISGTVMGGMMMSFQVAAQVGGSWWGKHRAAQNETSLVERWHDDDKKVTCWVTKSATIYCIPDKDL